MLNIYLLGCIAAFIATLFYECIVDFNWDLSRMSASEWVQDIVGSALSWATVALVVVMMYYTKSHPEVITRDCDKKKRL